MVNSVQYFDMEKVQFSTLKYSLSPYYTPKVEKGLFNRLFSLIQFKTHLLTHIETGFANLAGFAK